MNPQWISPKGPRGGGEANRLGGIHSTAKHRPGGQARWTNAETSPRTLLYEPGDRQAASGIYPAGLRYALGSDHHRVMRPVAKEWLEPPDLQTFRPPYQTSIPGLHTAKPSSDLHNSSVRARGDPRACLISQVHLI